MNKVTENFKQQQLQQWIRDAFRLSKNVIVNISEHRGGHHKLGPSHTEITIEEEIGKKHQYIVKKSINEIIEEDIRRMRRFIQFERLKRLPIIGNIFRFLGLWAAFTGIYAMFAVCPFCGQVGCPIGAGSAGDIFDLFYEPKRRVAKFFPCPFAQDGTG